MEASWAGVVMSIKGCGADLEPPLPECSLCNWYLQHVQRNADQDGQLLRRRKGALV